MLENVVIVKQIKAGVHPSKFLLLTLLYKMGTALARSEHYRLKANGCMFY